MSAFIVDDETINRFVSFANFQGSLSCEHYWCFKPLRDIGYQLDNVFHCKRLAEEMFTLNCESIEQRYGEGEAEKFGDLNFRHILQCPARMLQVVKSLSCFLYQCCEGDIPERNMLYNALIQVKSNLCEDIVTRLPEYEKMAWA